MDLTLVALTDADVAELALETLQPPLQLPLEPESERVAAQATGRRKRSSSSREEVEALRKEVERLSLELLAARSRGASGQVVVRRSSRPDGGWGAAAERQKRMREASQQENALLRKLVQAQGRHLRSVVRLTKRKPCRQEIDAQIRQLIGVRIQRQTPFGHDREEAFEFLLPLLTPLHAQLDVLWRLSRMIELPCPGRRVVSTPKSVRKDRKFEAIQSVVLPFEMKLVENELWTHLANPRLLHPSKEYSKLIGLRGDTLQLLLSIHNPEFNLKQTMCMASRKFKHDDHTVLVTATLTEPRLAVNESTLGVKALTTIVRVLKRGQMVSTGDQTTLIESNWSVQGLNSDCTSACSAELFEPFIELGKVHMLYTMNGEMEMIEDRLMNRRHDTISTR